MTGPLTPDELGDYADPGYLSRLEVEQLKGEAAYLAAAVRLQERTLEASREQLRLVMVELERRDFPEVAA